MIDFDDRASFTQGGFLGNFLHGQDRPARNIERIAEFHDIELVLGHGPFFDGVEYLPDLVQPLGRRGVSRLFFPFRFADQVADVFPNSCLGDEIDVSIGITLPAFAFQNPAGLSTA